MLKTRIHEITTDYVSRLAYLQNAEIRAQAGVKVSRVASVLGHNIWYQDVGQGAPVLFLHGLGASSLSWLLTMPALLGERRLLALDHIGHGRSDKPPLQYRVTDFVEHVEVFLDQLGLTNVDLVGNSLGGWIAARLAVKRPDLTRRLVLVGSAGLTPSPAHRARLEQIKFAPRTLSEMRDILSICFYDKARYANRVSVAVSYLFRQLESNFNTVESVIRSALDPAEWMDEHLSRIEARTLVLWGREDELMPVEQAERYAAGIRDAELEIFDRCGHVPQIERPKDFNRVINNFLKL